MRLPRAAADLLLLLIALIWGGSFVIVRGTLHTMPPFFLIGGRFLLALLALAIIFPRRFRAFGANLKPGLLLGLLLFGGFALQTLGLRHTSASASGFITGLNVIFVALLSAILGKERLPWRTIAGVVLATLGMLLLSFKPGGFRFGLGDLLTLGCAVFFALHIVATGHLVRGRDPVALTMVQFSFMAVASFLLNLFLGGSFRPPALPGWLALLYLGLLATAFAFAMQTAAQRYTPAVDTAIIFSTEPLFAAAIAVLLGGERLTAQMLIGGGAIFVAMLFSVLKTNEAKSVEANVARME